MKQVERVNSLGSIWQMNHFMKESSKGCAKDHDFWQKEFFFSRCVLLVEGDTELGAMPVLSRKMDLDFDNYGISVIAAGSSYFADFMDLLERFEISHIAMCDKDVLTNITSSIKVSTLDIITSILIKQLDDLNKLSDDDKRSS